MKMSSINLQHLYYFIVAARHQNYNLAAEKLFITTSTLSRAIQGLEETTGVPLFINNKGRVRLTDYGTVFYRYAYQSIRTIEEGIFDLQSMADIRHDTIHISCDSLFSIANNMIPSLLAYCQKADSNLKINFEQLPTSQMIKDLLDEKLDVVFASDFGFDNYNTQIETELLFEERLALAVPDAHPLAKKDQVTLQETVDLTFIRTSDNENFKKLITNLQLASISKKTYPIHTIHRVVDDNTLMAMVRNNIGVALVSENTIAGTVGVKILPIVDLPIKRPIYMIKKKENLPSYSVDVFTQYVRQFIAEEYK